MKAVIVIPKSVWKSWFHACNDFERMITQNNSFWILHRNLRSISHTQNYGKEGYLNGIASVECVTVLDYFSVAIQWFLSAGYRNVLAIAFPTFDSRKTVLAGISAPKKKQICSPPPPPNSPADTLPAPSPPPPLLPGRPPPPGKKPTPCRPGLPLRRKHKKYPKRPPSCDFGGASMI